jgi:uncharacterized protein (DUF427 family)
MKVPGPDHPITIERTGRPVVVIADAEQIASTVQAVTLTEAAYPPVQYLPREAVDPAFLRRSTHKTYCPYKGEASYFHIVAGERKIENAIWSYEDPYPAVAEIKDRLAFYPDRVRIVLG